MSAESTHEALIDNAPWQLSQRTMGFESTHDELTTNPPYITSPLNLMKVFLVNYNTLTYKFIENN